MNRNRRFRLIASLACLSPTPVLGQGTLSIIVVDERGRGVESDLFFLPSKGERQPLPSSGSDGTIILTMACKLLDRISAEPTSNRYRTHIEHCPSARPATLRIEVTSRETEENLIANAMYFEDQKDWAKSALIWSEYAARVPDSSVVARRNALLSFGQYANVQNVFVLDSTGKIYRVTNEFELAIKELQRRNAIAMTGQLDYETLRRIAGANIHEYMYMRHRPPEP